MILPAPRHMIRPLTLIALLSLSLGASACGSDDEKDEPSEQSIRETLAERKVTEDQRAKEMATRLYEIVNDARQSEADAEEFCELMSSQAQAQSIAYAKSTSKTDDDQKWDCESSVRLTVLASGRNGPKPKVIGVNTEGNLGTVSIDFGKSISGVSIVKEDDEWKLAGNSEPAPSSDPDLNAPEKAKKGASKGSSTLLP